MAVQKLAHDWRARRKKDGKTFNGPLRDTEVAANEDARQLEEASGVSSERLQEVFDRLSGLLSVPAAAQHGSNWRTRVKVSQATVCGPTRQSKAPAEEDARALQHARQISSAEVQSVALPLQQEAVDVLAPHSRDFTKHGSGWHAGQLQAALQISAEELQTVAERLQQEAVDVIARSSREARFDEIILAEMRDALGLQRQQKSTRLRARNVADDFDAAVASKSAQLLVSASQDVEALNSTARQR